jgi:hypothetical protein
MDIFRNARAKASEQLAKDEAALSTVLTARQEAALLASGLVN